MVAQLRRLCSLVLFLFSPLDSSIGFSFTERQKNYEMYQGLREIY